MRLLISESRNFSKEALGVLRDNFEVQLADLDRSELIREVRDYEILWVRLRNMIDGEVMEAAPRLKTIATNTTGLNHIDLEETSKRGIKVVSLRGETDFLQNIRATAEHTIALTLALLRHVPQAHQHAINGGWNRDLFSGTELYGKSVGIIGYGRLGKLVASYFRAFGSNVVVTDRELPSNSIADGFPVLELDALLASADLISLHASYEPCNHHMLSEAEFSSAKRGAFFINTARGELVDTKALLAALEAERLSGAALDVLEEENGDLSSRSTDLERFAGRLILTPHLGGNTRESKSQTEVFLAHKLLQSKHN